MKPHQRLREILANNIHIQFHSINICQIKNCQIYCIFVLYYGCVSMVRRFDSPTLLHNWEKWKLIRLMLLESLYTVFISMFLPLIWKKRNLEVPYTSYSCYLFKPVAQSSCRTSDRIPFSTPKINIEKHPCNRLGDVFIIMVFNVRHKL